jgi:hypothetical protein
MLAFAPPAENIERIGVHALLSHHARSPGPGTIASRMMLD